MRQTFRLLVTGSRAWDDTRVMDSLDPPKSPSHPISSVAVGGQRSLTAFSRTDRTRPDSGGQPGNLPDPDLRIRTLAHWPDRPH